MRLKKMTVPLEEHASASALAKDRKPLGAGTRQSNDLRLSRVRLAGAIAKTIYADPEVSPQTHALLAGIAYAQTRWLTAPIPGSTNLRLNHRHVAHSLGIRDFSRASRIGELGQGLCALFMQDHLALPIVLDFGVLCDLIAIQRPFQNQTQPDFAGWFGGGYKLVESKASLASDSIKAELREGLEQCQAGAQHIAQYPAPAPVGSFTVLAALQTEQAGKDSVIHFADPSVRGEPPPQSLHQRVVEHYYAGALRALGCPDAVLNGSGRVSRMRLAFAEWQSLELVRLPTTDLPAFIRYGGHADAHAPTHEIYLELGIWKAILSGDAKQFQRATARWAEQVRHQGDVADPAWTFWSDGLVMRLSPRDAG